MQAHFNASCSGRVLPCPATAHTLPSVPHRLRAASPAPSILSFARPLHPQHASSSAGAGDPSQEPANPPSTSGQQSDDAQKPSLWARAKRAFLGDKKMDRQRLAELGLGAFAAYGVISNLNALCLMTMAWITCVKTQGATPFAPGMWPKFLGIYAGLWLGISSFIRPLRLSLACAAAPAFDRAMGMIMERLKVNKGIAFGVLLLCIAAGSLTIFGVCICLLGGVPFPKLKG